MKRFGIATACAVLMWCPAAFGQAAGLLTSTMFGDVSDAATGKPVEGAVVVVRSPALQGEQIGTTDASGRYTITLLPPGAYSVHVEATGYKAFDQGGIVLPVGKTIRVNIALAPVAVVAKEVVVTAKQVATVDQGSTTTGIVLERELLEKIPLGRTYESALILTPASTVQDNRVGVGFAGSTGMENTFLIDGVNTTNTGFGVLSTNLPPEFLEQLEVKVGGYMPEFGRATGAIVNTIIRAGGNELHGDLFFNYSGPWLEGIRERIKTGAIHRRDSTRLNTDFGVAVGGPIIKDKLWFFVGLQEQIVVSHVNRYIARRFEDPTTGSYRIDPASPFRDPLELDVSRQIFETAVNTLRFATKLTWAPTSDQRIALSYFGNPSSASGVIAGVNGEPASFLGQTEAGAQNIVTNYLGKFLDKRVQVEGTAGYYREINRTLPTMRFNVNNGILQELRPQIPEPVCRQDPMMTIPTCPTGPNYLHSGFFNEDEVFQRGSLAAKVSFFLPRNLVKVGADLEWNTYHSRFAYSGGEQRLARFRRFRDLNGDGVADRELLELVLGRGNVVPRPDGTIQLVNEGVLQRSFSRNFGMFLQDSITILDNFTVNAGFRYEIQQLYGTEGDSALEDPLDPTSRRLNTVLTLNKNFAPRLGAIWDPFKDGRTKVFGSFGVYYESVPLDLALRALSPLDVFNASYNAYRQREVIVPIGVLGGHPTGIVDNISPQYIYEWIAGIEHEVLPTYRVGLTYMKRVLGNVVEDLSVDDGTTYFLGNPGRGARAFGPGGEIDRLRNDPNFLRNASSQCRFRDPSDINSMLCTGDFPEARRDYEAWTIFFEKRRTEDQPWQFRFSYTLSWLRGNYPGLFSPDNGQQDPNLTTLFDLPSLLVNKYGFLPNDHRHLLKIFGSYELPRKFTGNHTVTIGFGLNAESGAPVNALGTHEIYRTPEVSIFPRGFIPDRTSGEAVEGRLPWLISPDLFLEWAYSFTRDVRLSFNLVIFNFINRQEALFVDQRYTLDSVCPLVPGPDGRVPNISNLRQSAGFDPVTGACNPSDTPATPNPEYLKPTLRQLPISARFGLKLTF
jgi:hypothetical protein